jgi:hypothetical protein
MINPTPYANSVTTTSSVCFSGAAANSLGPAGGENVALLLTEGTCMTLAKPKL